MGAYAFGQMLKRFARRWTCVILYLDQRETEVFRFEYDEAREIVAGAIVRYQSPQPPNPNESCAWCANFYECPAQLELAGQALALGPEALAWPEILADPARLGRFLDGVRALERFAKEGRTKAREYFFQQTLVPGYTLAKGKRFWTLGTEMLLNLLCRGDELTVRKALRTAVELNGPIPRETYC
jgi:hypothetical protein